MSYKNIVLGLALLAVFSFAGNAKAADVSSQIQALMEQIKALQAQLAQLQSQQNTTTAWCHTFNTNMGVGTVPSESDLKALLTVLDGK
ncbi:MAG: FlxA-like family protein [Candidatus Staskawiczbacteria bacterium]|nr:FlxA-like family protein [Candidatus Staskawiczbacteria bacterium]